MSTFTKAVRWALSIVDNGALSTVYLQTMMFTYYFVFYVLFDKHVCNTSYLPAVDLKVLYNSLN